MTLSFFLENAWRWKVGLPEREWGIDVDNIEQTEWSKEFEILQRNRLIMGAIRYQRILAPDKPQLDRISGMLKYIKEYQETGNLECLVDIANYCLLEFVEGKHPNKHFYSSDDKYHVKPL